MELFGRVAAGLEQSLPSGLRRGYSFSSEPFSVEAPCMCEIAIHVIYNYV